MYFSDAISVLLRRWYVVVAGLMVIGGAAAAVMLFVPTNYQASGNVLFLLPPSAGGDKPVNPYINVPQGLTMASSIVGGVLSTPEEQRDLFASGFTSDYSVSQMPGTGIPLLYVTAQDTNSQMAVATVKEVIRRIDAELARMQSVAGAPAAQRMTSQSFSVTNQAEVVHGAKLRALAIVGALGVVLTTIAAFAVDRSRQLRRTRREAMGEGADHAATPLRPDGPPRLRGRREARPDDFAEDPGEDADLRGPRPEPLAPARGAARP